MPILSQKENPPSKPFECSILEKKGTWWVAKVMPRQEKEFAFELLRQGFDYYLPYYEKRTQRTDGKFRKSYIVLFPSYVPFIADKPYDFLEKRRVSTILPVKGQEKFRNQLNFICTAFGSGNQVIHLGNDFNLAVGDIIRVTSGPCKGLSGRITTIKNNKYILFNVDALGYVLMNIMDSQVELAKAFNPENKSITTVNPLPTN